MTVSASLWATSGLFAIAAFWWARHLILWVLSHQHRAVPILGSQDLTVTQATADQYLRLAQIGYLITGVLFLIWFFQAYMAAASRGATGRSWGAGWTIGGWLIPIAWFVIPKLVMNEVDQMSNPSTGQVPIGDRWRKEDSLSESDAWWALYVASLLVVPLGFVFLPSLSLSDTTYGWATAAIVVGLIAMVGAGLAGGGMVKEIGKRLADPASTVDSITAVDGLRTQQEKDLIKIKNLHVRGAITDTEWITLKHQTLSPDDPSGAARRAHDERLAYARRLHDEGRYTDSQLLEFERVSRAELERNLGKPNSRY